MALRFHELNIRSVIIARMDITNAIPPSQGIVGLYSCIFLKWCDLNQMSHLLAGFIISPLPSLVMLPAYNKEPPYKYFSGVMKVASLMYWIEENVDIKFKLPHLPQFNDHDRVYFMHL
jgi:hypothetical protein